MDKIRKINKRVKQLKIKIIKTIKILNLWLNTMIRIMLILQVINKWITHSSIKIINQRFQLINDLWDYKCFKMISWNCKKQ